mmetsp:Transcript_35927/g.67024  ORF Transcript_35927/g.67024 Transcript_35927/m.67024 type:complete len:1039 (-) Transcript_35927:285-3401(-)
MSTSLDETSNSQMSMADTFKGRNTAKTGDELKKARESRAAEALRMKDDQLRILAEQNSKLLASLDKVEDEANTIQMEKLSVEQENRTLRDNNFELQSKARAAETQSKRMQTEVADKEKQLRIMTDQNSELLRLLESEEGLTLQLQSEVQELRSELDELRQKHGSLLTTAKTHEEMSTKAAREGQLRAEEIRLLRAETEQLKQQNSELKMKTQVEVEALQEQLRVRKEKQYQLLEKLQAQEEAKRQAEDQVTGMEEQLRSLHARNVELETQLQFEARIKQNLEETNKDLQLECSNANSANQDLQAKIDKSEKERLRMESEARDSAEQLREMAEKVFQLLERLKLAELGKTKAMEALKKKELDMVALQKKNARLIKESTEEGRARVKAELDVKVLQDQVRAIKKHNSQLTQKSKEEAHARVKAVEENDQLKEKMTVVESRLSFLLNKVQADEEARVIQSEDRKKLEAQVQTLTAKCEEFHHKLSETGESNRIITQAMRLKQEELNEVTMKYELLYKETESREANEDRGGGQEEQDMTGARAGAPDDIDNVRLNEGRGRFYVEVKTIGGGSMLLLRGRKPLYREWMDKQSVNDFLKRCQKTTRFRDMIIEKVAALYGLLMVEEEEKNKIIIEVQNRDKLIDHLQKKLIYVQDNLATEEDAKRRMLLRYIHAIKEQAATSNDGLGGVLQLPESNVSDEEIHALAALLRNNMSIDELNLRGNNITDDGARALAAVLSGRSGLRTVDLRGNRIGKSAIRILAEALERAERVRHVYVHAGGKIEALGTGKWNKTMGDSMGDSQEMGNTAKQSMNVETVCVVDIRDNYPEKAIPPFDVDENNLTSTIEPTASSTFAPSKMIESTGAPRMSNSTTKLGSKSNENLSKTMDSALAKSQSSNAFSLPSKMDKKKEKQMLKAKRENDMRESAWSGRSGGMDISKSVSKDSLYLQSKKAQRGDLPPLPIEDGTMFDDQEMRENAAPVRASSAPDPFENFAKKNSGNPDSPENIVKGAILKARGKANRKKKISKSETRLLDSPFARTDGGGR